MTTLSLALLLSLSANGAIEHETATAAGMTLAVDVFELDNGLRVNVIEDHSMPTVAVVLVYGVGSRDEEKGRSGFAHMFEHMMFKGSKNVPEGGQFLYVEKTGGSVTAFTEPDITAYVTELPSNYIDMALWMESDRMRSLEITAENFDNQRSAVQEERVMKVENEAYIPAYLNFFAEAWKGSGYGHTVIGTQADLDAANVAEIQQFFDLHYAPNNAVLAIAGDVDAKAMQERVQTYFGDIARGPDRKPFPKVDHKQSRFEREVEDPHARLPIMVVAWKTVVRTHPDHAALQLLQRILWEGESSRVVKKLDRSGKGLQADFGFNLIAGHDAGLLGSAFVPLSGATLEEIDEMVSEEIEAVKARGVSDTELQRVKNAATVDAVTELTENVNKAYSVARGTLEERNSTRALAELERYRKVTRKDIQRVAKTYLTAERMTLRVIPKS